MLKALRELVASIKWGRQDDWERPRVDVEGEGFSFSSRAGLRRVTWSQVTKVETYKRDLWIHDTIELAFHLAPRGEVCVISEDAVGFPDLAKAAEAALGIDGGWYAEVMLPPFEERRRVLFERREHLEVRDGMEAIEPSLSGRRRGGVD
jgi:hypothetical protein